MDALMPIGDFSEQSGLSAKRLRTYAAAGLLVPAAVDPESGYRYYAPGQVHEARTIDALRRADVPLAAIAELLRDPSSEQLDRWMKQVEIDSDERRGAIRKARELLDLEQESSLAQRPESVREERGMKFTATARTDRGRDRERNEDRTVCGDRIVAVADGMGGHPGGETAASLVVSVLGAAFSGSSVDELAAVVRAANAAVFERAHASPDLGGMGTTVCAVGLTDDGDLAVVNVGDSRAYLIRDRSMQRLTTDHTLVAELVRQGELSEDDIADHPQRSVLTRAVGVGPTVDVDAALHQAHPGDRVVLCTDGLSNEVGEDFILSAVNSGRDSSSSTAALIEQALANGGHDNITVLIADVSS